MHTAESMLQYLLQAAHRHNFNILQAGKKLLPVVSGNKRFLYSRLSGCLHLADNTADGLDPAADGKLPRHGYGIMNRDAC